MLHIDKLLDCHGYGENMMGRVAEWQNGFGCVRETGNP